MASPWVINKTASNFTLLLLRQLAKRSNMRTVLLTLVLFSIFLSTVTSVRTGGGEVPHYTRPPRTSFSCKGRGNGYFADPEAHCAAYHVCDNGRKHSFVCPVTTLFNQQLLTCDYSYNVVCEGAEENKPYEAEREQGPQARTIDAGVEDENRVWREETSTAASHHHHNVYPNEVPGEATSKPSVDSTTRDWQSQFSTTKPAVMWIVPSTEAPITVAYTETTTEPATTKAPIRKPVKSPKPKTVKATTSTTTTTTTTERPSSQSSNARAGEEEPGIQVRNEIWLKELPKTTTETVDSESVVPTTLTPEVTTSTLQGNSESKTEAPYVSRGGRKNAASNSLIATMMKWASTNIKQQYDSNNSNKSSNRSAAEGDEAGEKMKSPFELEQELSSAKPLAEPVTEVSPYEFPIGPSNEIEGEEKPRPVYFPPSVTSHSASRGRSIYVAESKRSQIFVPSSAQESLDHPSPWMFPMQSDAGGSRSSSSSSGNLVNSGGSLSGREVEKEVPSKSLRSQPVAGGRSKLSVGVVREGRCVCSDPTDAERF